jgi:spermidine synthase
MAVATYVAVAINVAVAVVGLGLATLVPHSLPAAETEPASPAPASAASAAAPQSSAPAPANDSIYVAIALSGATALGAEVVWTRLLSLMLGTTVYTISIILAVFLVGLGIGSSVGSLLARQTARPRVALGVCQLLLMAAVAWAGFTVAHSLPYWPIDSSLTTDFWEGVPVDIARCVYVTMPATILWGASFPLALAAVAGKEQDSGVLVGRVYAANTVGAIVGAVGTSVVLIGSIGTQQSQRLLIVASAVAGLVVLVPLLRMTTVSPGRGRLAVVASVVLALFLTWSVDPIPPQLIAYGRYPPTYFPIGDILFAGEGMNSSVAVMEDEHGHRSFHVSGRPEATTYPEDMRMERMLGHIPALLHPKPKTVLVVGCGAGVTAGSFVLHPDVERIVICEIEPLIPKVVATNFSEENYDVLQDPRVEIVYDDARHYILTTEERFDIITTDPIHPWVKGSATLYTEEYFELVKRHLKPGGIVAQWVPIYESTEATVKSQFATFFAVFSDGVVWSNDYDVVLMGRADPGPIDVDEVVRRLAREDHAEVLESLADVGFNSAIDLLASYGGRASDLESWLEDSVINRDRNLRLQYLAGMGLNSADCDQIVIDLNDMRKFSEDLFVGGSQNRLALREALEMLKGLTKEERETFEAVIGEIYEFGDDETAKELAKEVEDVYQNGSLKDQREWLEKYASAEINQAERALFDAYVKKLNTLEERKGTREVWEGLSAAAKRYYLMRLR